MVQICDALKVFILIAFNNDIVGIMYFLDNPQLIAV